MPTINFAAIPSGVSVTDERINQLNTRATETGAAFSRRIENLTQAYADAQTRFAADADSFVGATSGADRNVAKQLAKKRLAKQARHATQADRVECGRLRCDAGATE